MKDIQTTAPDAPIEHAQSEPTSGGIPGQSNKSRRTSSTFSPRNEHTPLEHSASQEENVERDSQEKSAPVQKPSHLDIANYPSADLLKMLAALLQHIATSNDQLRPLHSARSQEQMQQAMQRSESSGSSPPFPMALNDPRRPSTTTAALTTLNAPSSTLCFHARHVPSISIEAYLLRILKYCPTTNDVFLSLLVYFDRLSRVGATGSFPDDPPVLQRTSHSNGSSTPSAQLSPNTFTPQHEASDAAATQNAATEPPRFPGIRGFAIDSYNVHRLVIAGITVASKFFSDVFYTNARYAKVGGLAVHELNQLELHFLLLTDFRLMISITEIQQYGDQLLAYAHDRSAASKLQHPVRRADSRSQDTGQDS